MEDDNNNGDNIHLKLRKKSMEIRKIQEEYCNTC